MAITAKPEILGPRTSSARRLGGGFTDENLDLLSHLLDDFIRIPGTNLRFGLDGIVGFIPGAGDIIGGLASSIIIIAAWMRGVPKVVVARMVLNVAIETGVGAVPLLGNLFDIGWKANRRNYALLREATAAQGGVLNGHESVAANGAPAAPASGFRTAPAAGFEKKSGSSWLFIAGVCFTLAILMLVPVLLLGWLLAHVGHSVLGMDLHRFSH